MRGDNFISLSFLDQFCWLIFDRNFPNFEVKIVINPIILTPCPLYWVLLKLEVALKMGIFLSHDNWDFMTIVPNQIELKVLQILRNLSGFIETLVPLTNGHLLKLIEVVEVIWHLHCFRIGCWIRYERY